MALFKHTNMNFYHCFSEIVNKANHVISGTPVHLLFEKIIVNLPFAALFYIILTTIYSAFMNVRMYVYKFQVVNCLNFM